MKTLTKLIVPLLLGVLAACGDEPTPGSGPVTVAPKSVTVKAGDSATFTASVEGTRDPKILWSVEGEASGTITSTGVYTAPAQAGSYTVVATNALDGTKKDTASVTVTPAVVVTITPASPTVGTAGSIAFTAQVTGASDTSVTWSLKEGDAAGTLTAAGVYTAPGTPGTFTVVATSVADPSRSASTQVKVEAVAVSVKPNGTTVDQGAVVEFSADVTGASNTGVTWSVEGGGTITSSGIYTAPTQAGTVTVTATSLADSTKKGSATLSVRELAVTISPASQTIPASGTAAFYATVTGTTASTAVTWSVEGGSTHGTITSSGVYTAPSKAGTYTVFATSVANPAKKATAQVTVGAVSVTISPATVTIAEGTTTTFTAEVTGASNQAVLWSVEGGDGNGTITSSGVYTAPARPGTFTVVATSAVNPDKKATAIVTVTASSDVVVTITPATQTIPVSGTAAFYATVTGTTNTAVTWSVEGDATHGTITSSGVYTAPSTPGTFTVVATSVANPTKKATAQVTVEPVSVTITPATITLAQGATATFTAEVTGTSNQAVLWSVEGGDGNGIITSSGIYTAPARPGTFTVVATSAVNPDKKATATATVPVAQGGDYTDPTGSGWKLVKNTSASSGNHLVLDLVGPAGGSGRGVDLTLSVNPEHATWAKMAPSDTEYVTNRLFELGAAPRLIKGGAKAGTLSVGVFQKGTTVPATSYSGALVSVALDVKLDPSTPAGTRIPLSVIKAHALPETGDLSTIDVAVGTIVTQ